MELLVKFNSLLLKPKPKIKINECSQNKMSNKGCQMGPKNNQDWKNIYVLPFKTMTSCSVAGQWVTVHKTL